MNAVELCMTVFNVLSKQDPLLCQIQIDSGQENMFQEMLAQHLQQAEESMDETQHCFLQEKKSLKHAIVF